MSVSSLPPERQSLLLCYSDLIIYLGLRDLVMYRVYDFEYLIHQHPTGVIYRRIPMLC